MKKLKSGTYKYKFALITKERTSFGESVWRCSLTNTIRNFPSRRDAKRYVDDVEVSLRAKAAYFLGSSHEPVQNSRHG